MSSVEDPAEAVPGRLVEGLLPQAHGVPCCAVYLKVGDGLSDFNMGILEELAPHGDTDTWRQLQSRRKVLEQQGIWSRACRKSGLEPTGAL